MVKKQGPSKYKSIDGKRYEVYDLCFSEDEAIEEADDLRKEGFFVRRIKTRHDTWQIYRRKK